MKKDPAVFINHIIESIALIERYVGSATKSEYLKNTEMQDAVMRRIEIIGEATKCLVEEFKSEHSEIPWRNIAGMRDKLIHEYFGVDLELVWEVVKKDLPELKRSLERA
ncbi:DUF86 domain-containing protein [Candidatus Uhrbacteria bacterium]|nr:DUF86 domain-containing protein [Candidatus Uhrbacteria bacterium]